MTLTEKEIKINKNKKQRKIEVQTPTTLLLFSFLFSPWEYALGSYSSKIWKKKHWCWTRNADQISNFIVIFYSIFCSRIFIEAHHQLRLYHTINQLLTVRHKINKIYRHFQSIKIAIVLRTYKKHCRNVLFNIGVNGVDSKPWNVSQLQFNE